MIEKPMHSRRVFLARGVTILAAAPTVPTFLEQTVFALANPLDTPAVQQPSGRDGKILVVVQLSGGNDGLNTVVPYADDAYHSARPSLRVAPERVLRLNDYVGLHPNLAPLRDMLDQDRLTIVQGVGYPNPNRSHFRSMDIWHSARPDDEQPTSGWLGRYFDNTCDGADPHAGVSIGDTLPLSMKGQKITPLSFERPENYRYRGDDAAAYETLNRGAVPTQDEEPLTRVIAAPRRKVSAVTQAEQVDFLTRTAMDAQLSSDTVRRMASAHRPRAQYPGGEFGAGLRTIAAMIRGGLPTRVYYVALGGFDTHANQSGRHDQLMTQFAQGMQAFWEDLREQKNDQRVLALSFSEFGRRVAQNASAGTDHGAAAPMFLMGPSVRSGVLGTHPSLTDLDAGDLKFGTDFRSIYATVLQEWLDTPSKPILGQQFKTLRLLRA